MTHDLVDVNCAQCTKPVHARGLCKPCYERVRRAAGGYPRGGVEDNFWAKVDRRGDDECWLWTASLRGGYGQFRVGRRKVCAHRYAYELLIGPIPDEFQLDHRVSCDKRCVNPRHLRLATNKQNGENLAGARGVSGIRGVCWNAQRQKWSVQVMHNKKHYYGGWFSDIDEAATAARALRNRLFTHNNLDRQPDQADPSYRAGVGNDREEPQ